MPKFTVGEQVGFLYEREAGTGKVLKILSDGQFMVEHPSGMDIPYYENQLVKLKQSIEVTSSPNEKVNLPNDCFSLIFEKTSNNITSYLWNGFAHERFIVIYTSTDGVFKKYYSGILASNEKALLLKLSFEDWLGMKKIKLKSLQLSDYSAESELVTTTRNFPAKDFIQKLELESNYVWPIREEMSSNPMSSKPIKPPIVKSNQILKVVDNTAEIDLHIEELIDDLSGMDNHQKLTFQLNHLNRCINEAMERRLRKLTIIHGVGKGVLKAEVEKYLKDISNISMQASPMSKFGMGATDVFFRH